MLMLKIENGNIGEKYLINNWHIKTIFIYYFSHNYYLNIFHWISSPAETAVFQFIVIF